VADDVAPPHLRGIKMVSEFLTLSPDLPNPPASLDPKGMLSFWSELCDPGKRLIRNCFSKELDRLISEKQLMRYVDLSEASYYWEHPYQPQGALEIPYSLLQWSIPDLTRSISVNVA
jgi:hypothetical protein